MRNFVLRLKEEYPEKFTELQPGVYSFAATMNDPEFEFLLGKVRPYIEAIVLESLIVRIGTLITSAAAIANVTIQYPTGLPQTIPLFDELIPEIQEDPTRLAKDIGYGKIEDIKECPICKEDGEMIGTIVNEKTYVWSCNACPAVLFEFESDDNTKDLDKYLKLDAVKKEQLLQAPSIL